MYTLPELKNLSLQELDRELQNAGLELYKLRLGHANSQLKETHKLKLYRKYVARLQTMKRYIATERPSTTPKKS